MKVKIVSAISSLAVVLCAFAAAFMLPSGRSLFTASRSSAVTVAQSATASRSGSSGTSSAGTGYTIKPYNGSIGVFTDGSDTPGQIIAVNPNTLPQSEADRLAGGIHVDTHDELLAILENYTS